MNSAQRGFFFLIGSTCLLAQAPLTGEERLKWVVKGTVGPASLAAGVFSAGLDTWTNTPEEYGPHWEGFGKRYGMRLTGIATNRTIEAGVGALWGEDPRYRRLGSGEPAKARVLHAVKWTFLAANGDGGVHPSYARYVSWTGGSFLSSAWRPDSDADIRAGVSRIYLGVLLRMASNAVDEFGPDLRHRHSSGGSKPADNSKR